MSEVAVGPTVKATRRVPHPVPATDLTPQANELPSDTLGVVVSLVLREREVGDRF